MFSNQFILTREEHLLQQQQEREKTEQDLKRRQQEAEIEAAEQQKQEFSRYVEKKRPDLLNRVQKIRTLIVNPLNSTGGGEALSFSGRETGYARSAAQSSASGSTQVPPPSTWSTPSSQTSQTERASHVVASRRSSLAPDPSQLDAPSQYRTSVKLPQTQKLVCHYSFDFDVSSEITSMQLRTLGKDGYVESLDELGEKWRHLLDVHQFEAYYLTRHDALQRFLKEHGKKIQRLFLKVHPYSEEFLSFRSAEAPLLMENLNILHLEIPRSMRSQLCDEMQYLLYSALEFFLHVQKERFSSSPSFKTVDNILFENFMKHCNTQLRHCTLEGISLTKMWIVSMLETFKSLQSLSIRLCRRVIAREENEVVKHASSVKDMDLNGEQPEATDSAATAANEGGSVPNGDTTQDHTIPGAQIHNLKSTPDDATLQADSIVEVEPLITLRTPHTALTSVFFSQTDAVNDETLLTVAVNCPTITDLFISETYVTQKSLLFISQHLRKLRRLSFFGPKLSEIEFCPLGELTKLELNGHHCTVDAFVTLSLCFPKLQRINLGAKKPVFEGKSINQFVNITRGEDAQQKERFLSYAQDKLDDLFDNHLYPSKDVNLTFLRENIEDSIVAMKQPESEGNASIAFAMVLGERNVSPVSPSSPSTPTNSSLLLNSSTASNAPSPSATYTALRRNTLALPTVRRRIGFELFFDALFEFLSQYAIVDDLAKKVVKVPSGMKKKVLKKKGKKKKGKKGAKKGKKKKK